MPQKETRSRPITWLAPPRPTLLRAKCTSSVVREFAVPHTVEAL